MWCCCSAGRSKAAGRLGQAMPWARAEPGDDALSLQGFSMQRGFLHCSQKACLRVSFHLVVSVLISVCWCPVYADGMVLFSLLITSTTRKAPLHPTCRLSVSGSDPTLSFLGKFRPQITLCSMDAHQHNESGGVERLLGGETRGDWRETTGSTTTSHLLPLTRRHPTLLGAP